jgi:hypothetical protein
MIVLTSWLAALFLKASRRLLGEHALLPWWTLVWALAPPVLTHGYVFFTEVPTAIVAVLCYLHRNDLAKPRWVINGLWLGVLTGFLTFLHIRNVGLVIALAGLTGWSVRHDPRRLSGYSAGLLLVATLKGIQNYVFWNTIVTSPYARLGEWPGVFTAASEMTLRFGAMLFDGAHGLFLSAPIYLLTPAAMVLLWRRSPKEARELPLLIGSYWFFVLLPVTNPHGWEGGWSPAARFLMPIAPFLALPVAVLLAAGRSRWVAAAIVVIQVLISRYLWAHPMWSWSGDEGPSPWLARFVGPQWASVVPSWPITRPFDTTSWIALSGGALVVISVTFVLLRAQSRGDEPATQSP